MKALALDFEAHTLGWWEVEPPEFFASREVRYRVHEVGVCGTDRALAAFHLGEPPEGESHLVLGHEALGQVTDTGSGVTTLNRGDWVVPTVRRACHPPCDSCARGRRDLCLTGKYAERGIFRLHGFFTEHAVDLEEDLVRVPLKLVGFGVLVEPLSVVEKAIARALAVHEGEPRTALVLGLGPIGMLTAMALKARGYAVCVNSAEPADHPRAAILKLMDIPYQHGMEGSADMVFEATGSVEVALYALAQMPPLAVMTVLGAKDGAGPVPFLRMIVNNQTVVGCVNASPEAFRAAVDDLARFDSRAMAALITRARFADLPRSLTGPPLTAPKVVHVL
ncbi:MAG TPA: alcohol dehydrogenase catalytic domain-containing protein [Bryobacteraceae bacterium]|nr:alcohol dehydrogenase catalytic domain-containing protein [Bryobacteraceae bacterium]